MAENNGGPDGVRRLSGRDVERILGKRRLIDLNGHLSELDAFNEYFDALTPEQKERERLLLLAIADSAGEGTP